MGKKNTKKKEFQPIPKKILLALIITVILISVVLVYKNRKDLNYMRVSKLLPTAPVEFKVDTPADIKELKQNYVNMAIDDLVRKLRIDESLIQIEKVEEIDFSDTSLGCPQKNRMYSQVITPGYIIQLQYLQKNFIYHAGLNTVVSCKGD